MNAAPTPHDQARLEARPYAEAIVATREHPARFNRADIDHAIDLEAGAIASTAVSRGQSVETVVRRCCPEIFDERKEKAA